MLSRIHILLIFAVFTVHIATAQSYERSLHWSATAKSYGTSTGTAIKMPTFDGAVANYRDGYLPHYTENIRLHEEGKITATLTNELYEPIIDNTIKSDKIASTVSILAYEGMMKKKPYAVLSIVPLRRNALTGQVEKLVQFTLKIEVANSKQGRGTASYTATSVLASGSWYKVAVGTTGIYKLDHDFLATKCGFDLANTNFSSIGVFGNGGGMIPDQSSVARLDDLQENPSYIVDHNGNNKVDADDYILFYGQGADKWTVNSTTNLFDFEKNLYSDKNYYFITSEYKFFSKSKRLVVLLTVHLSAPCP